MRLGKLRDFQGCCNLSQRDQGCHFVGIKFTKFGCFVS